MQLDVIGTESRESVRILKPTLEVLKFSGSGV
jgi:hypothetical protein